MNREARRRSAFGQNSFLRLTSAKSDLKITSSEISKQSRDRVFIAIYGAREYTLCVLMNKRLISSSANNRALYQPVNPFGQLPAVTSSNRFPDVSQLRVYLLALEKERNGCLTVDLTWRIGKLLKRSKTCPITNKIVTSVTNSVCKP